MLFIPLPFVVAILLFILFVVVAKRDDDPLSNWPFLGLILATAVQSVLVGLRWGYGLHWVGHVAPVLAALAPPLVHAGVARLVRTARRPWYSRLGRHLIPAAVVVALASTWREAIDLALVSIFVGYAVAVLLLMRPGADALRLAPFDGAVSAYHAIQFAAGALLLSAAFDALIYFDFEWAHGEYAVALISSGNVFALIILGIAAAAAAGRSAASVDTGDTAHGSELADIAIQADISPPVATREDKVTIGAVDALMGERKLYRDVNLNLERLARKAGIPARQISGAINRATAKNVSQYVNEYRIAEACQLLAETGKSVTEIMFDVGFQTKSNFNREFRRVTDMAPLDWRERRARDR